MLSSLQIAAEWQHNCYGLTEVSESQSKFFTSVILCLVNYIAVVLGQRNVVIFANRMEHIAMV